MNVRYVRTREYIFSVYIIYSVNTDYFYMGVCFVVYCIKEMVCNRSFMRAEVPFTQYDTEMELQSVGL
jgi:hypothetical protein